MTADLFPADVLHADVCEVLNALGLGAHARPYSTHEVMQREILPAIRALTADSTAQDTTRRDDDATAPAPLDLLQEWADELWHRAIDSDSKSGPAMLANALRLAADTGDPAARNAPAWVHAVTPAEIVRQRSLGWPDFHPEDFCHQCGRRNPVWWVASEHWNRAVDGSDRGVVDILCPSCFCAAWHEATGQRGVWEIRLEMAR